MEEKIITIGDSDGNKPNRHRQPNNFISRLTFILLAVCAIAICVVVIICVFAFIPGKKNELVGTWIYNESIHYTFEEDGKGHLADSDYEYRYTYKAEDGEIILDFEADFVEKCSYKYTIKDDELTLVGGEGTNGGTYSLKRADH